MPSTVNTPGGPNNCDTNDGQRQAPCQLQDRLHWHSCIVLVIVIILSFLIQDCFLTPAASIDGLTGQQRTPRLVEVQLQPYLIGHALAKDMDITQMFRPGFPMMTTVLFLGVVSRVKYMAWPQSWTNDKLLFAERPPINGMRIISLTLKSCTETI